MASENRIERLRALGWRPPTRQEEAAERERHNVEGLMSGVTGSDGAIRRRTCNVQWLGVRGYRQRPTVKVLK